jgi:hypothetical protein
MQVCVADINGDTVKGVADEIGGLAVTVDVAAVVKAATEPVQASGTGWIVQYGRPPYAFEFRNVEGHEQFKPAD